MRDTASNIFLPMYAVIERESPEWAYYFFILLDYAPLVLVSMVTLLCTGLVGVSACISEKGWEDKEFRTSVGVFQVHFQLVQYFYSQNLSKLESAVMMNG